MTEPLSVRRMAENEAVFRRYNEDVQQSFDKIRRLARETNQEHLIPDDDTSLHFYCECSDENCQKRLQMKPSMYTKIHKKRTDFVVLCGHETDSVEKIIDKCPNYCVVRKFIKPPETVLALNPTGVDNS